jgi:hypothetical protein
MTVIGHHPMLESFNKSEAGARWRCGTHRDSAALIIAVGMERPWAPGDFIVDYADTTASNSYFYWEWNALRWDSPWPIRVRVRGARGDEVHAQNCCWWQRDVRVCFEGCVSTIDNLTMFFGLEVGID